MAIKEIVKSKKFVLKTIKCDKTDIKYILNLLKENGIKFKYYRLGNYRLNEIEDLEKLDLFETSLFRVQGKLTTEESYYDSDLEIIFKFDDCYIYLPDYNYTNIFGLANKINDFLKEKYKPKSPYWLLAILWALPSLIIGAGWLAFNWINLPYFFVYYLILFIFLIRIQKKLKTPLIVIKGQIEKHFLIRNKDTIILSIINLLLGGFIGYLVGKL